MNKNRSGAIVIVALMMVSVIVMITEQLMRSVFVGSRFTKTMMEREKAKALALSGINIAMAQLLAIEEKDSDDKDDEKKDDQKQAKQGDAGAKAKGLLKVLLPNLNRWQRFKLEEKTEGIEGSIKICVVSEHGKINLNEAFDFEKQEFKKEYATLLGSLEIENKLPAGEMLKALQEFLVNRKKKLHDISELIGIKAIDKLELFYKPPMPASNKKDEPQPNRNLTLQDIFTLWTPTAEIHPLLLSDALCAMLNLRRPRAGDEKTLKEEYKKLIGSYSDSWAQNWDQNWKNLAVIYKDKPPALKNLQAVFAKQFEPVIYSVLSYGNVGQTEQQLLAIIKKVKEKKVVQQADNQPGQKKDSEDQESFKIIRMYWL